MGLRRVQAGEPLVIEAPVWNRLVGLLETRTGSSGRIGLPNDASTCLVSNGTGEEIPWRGVVGLSSPLILPTVNESEFYNRFAFVGVHATSVDYPYNWGIALEPIAVGDIGLVRIDGLAHCLINMPDGGTPQFAGPADDGSVDALIKADCGARVIWREAGTDAQRAIVIL